MTIIKQELKFILLFLTVFIIEIVLFQNKTIITNIDFGREAYNPEAILNGAVLYKDIFNIFGPFSYLFNAFVYKLLGSNLYSLYIAGYLNTIVLSSFIYLCAKKIMEINLARIFVIFFVVYCCFTQSLMNYITPYAYAIVYGLTFFFISLFFFLEYLEKGNKINAFWAFVACGFSISSKYEFIIYSFLLIFCYLRTKPEIKNILLNLLFLILPSFLMFFYLFLKGLTVQDFWFYLKDLKGYITSPSLQMFYSTGLKFKWENFVRLLTSLLSVGSAIIIYYFLFSFAENKNRLIKWLILTVSGAFGIILINFNKTFFLSYLFCYLPFLVFVCYLIKIKEIWKEQKYFFIITASILVSAKIFWLLITTYSYGQYFLPINLLSVFVLLFGIFLKTSKKTDFYIFLFSIFIIAILVIDIPRLIKVNHYLKLPNGEIALREREYIECKSISNFIMQYTTENDEIIILPESPLLNFMIGRKTDNYYHSLKKENVEAFGEKAIIDKFQKTKPAYFIVFYYPSSSLNFGVDYAEKVYSWIENNYKLIGIMETDINIYIYSRVL